MTSPPQPAAADPPPAAPAPAPAFVPAVDWIRRGIAVLQVVGGAVGLWFAIPILLSPGILIGLPFTAFYAGCILAGIGLWRQSARGERWSRLLQLVQIPWVKTAHFAWQLASGAGLWTGISSTGWTSERRLGSTFNFLWATGFGPQFDNAPWTMGVNYLALIVLGYLLFTGHRRSAGAER